MAFEAHIETILNRHRELASLMADPARAGDFVKLSKEYAQLQEVVDAAHAYKNALKEQTDLEALLADPDMKEIATAELETLKEKIPDLEHVLHLALLPKDDADARNAILEVRAGTGGDEAALFAGDLVRMYKAYAALKGWTFDILELSESDLGGIKDAVISVEGINVFSRLKFESGGHRVQRVPDTEGSGRVHTSAATVAVLPEAEEAEVHINEGDLRIDTYRASGAGGQHVNRTDSAVRITHLPTGTVVAIQDGKSQHKNKAKAMMVLKSRILEAEREKLHGARAAERKTQIGSGDRSERVRTYNFPQGRVTEHRVNLTLYSIDRVMNGQDLDVIIEALIREDQAERMASLQA